jgi:hypothetical protein
MEKPVKYLLATVLPLSVLTGCAISSGHALGPNGRPVHWIDGMSASVAYEKANRLCPHGYNILGNPEQKSIIDYVMTVECKAPRSVAKKPQPAAQLQSEGQIAATADEKSQEQQLQELVNTPGLSYEEYQRRYREIKGQ